MATPAPSPGWTIRPISEGDRAAWATLFGAYRTVGGLQDDPAVVDRLWRWIASPEAQTQALVADDGSLIRGLAHFRVFERPITATTGLWIDDLYVDPAHRGQGIARMLIEAIKQRAGQDGHDVVRWTTKTDNPARRLYDRVAAVAPVVVYNAQVEEERWHD